MKTIFAFIIISMNFLTFSQSLSQSEKQVIINNLDSTKYWVREKAILDILKFKISEALPKLEQNIFNQEQDIASLYLNGLFSFNSTFAINYAHKFIDTVENLKGIPGKLPESSDSYGIKFMKYQAATLLFEKGDFSRADIIISWFDFINPKITALMPKQLSLILNNLPQDEVKAKNELLRIANSSESQEYSSEAVTFLVEHYGEGIIPDLLNIFSKNKYYLTRRYILGYLDNLNYTGYENFLKTHFNMDTSLTDLFLEKLIKNYPTPSNLSFIEENIIPTLSNFDRDYYNIILHDFEPIPPKNLSTILEYLNYTISLCDTLKENLWIGDINFVNNLKSFLQSSKVNLNNVDSLNCAKSIKEFQDSVDYVFKDSLNSDPRFITLDGWKFLYYNAQNILDRLPAIPEETTANLTVKLTNSIGSLLTGGSLQYYEGSWKDAVNNGDGTFAVNTDKQSLSLRMTYEYGTQTVSNVPAQNNTFTFQTVNTVVQLKNSQGNLINEEGTATSGAGQVKYYAGAWRDFGSTVNGFIKRTTSK